MNILNKFLNNPFSFVNESKLSDLTKLIRYANTQYHNSDKPVMSDQEFDLLIDELKKRKPNHSLLKKIGEQVHTKKKTKLPFHMGSMDKIKPGKDLVNKWITKYKGPYVISDKLDGTSGLLVLPDCKLYTRGDGTNGTDISSIVNLINGIPKYNSKKRLVVRGEFLISKNKFSKFSKTYTNSRAMINGLINKKCATPEELKLIDFVSYEIVSPSYNMSKQFTELKRLKFKVVYNKILNSIDEVSLSNILKKRKSNSSYDIDGIIIVDDNKHTRNVSGNPKYAFAYKDILEDQQVNATITKVEWRISKDGLIKPRVHLKPVKIGGITIKHVTGHNAKYIKENGIGKGAVIKLIRSGDVIPYILDVIKRVKPQFPDIEYIWNKSNVDIKVINMSNKSKNDLLIKNMVFFFKKMEIKNIDESIIKKFISVNLNSINKILKAKVCDFLKIDGFKDVMANKIYNNIHKTINGVPLPKVMAASNLFGSGLGEKKLTLIVKSYPNILNLKLTKSKLIEKINLINGFSSKTSSNFADNLPNFKKFIKLNSMIKIKKMQLIKVNKLYNELNFVFTGFRNKDWISKIELGGGKVTNTVTSKTNILVVKDINDTSSKITKAKSLGIKIISIQEFQKKYI